MLKIEKLKAGLLPPLTFEVADGECLAVEGPSGSGKTRLLRAIADLDPAGGQIFLDGAERHEIAAPEWRRQVRYVPAEPAWWSDTARDAFTRADAARLARLVSALGLDIALIDQPIDRLSTGERQRLAIARALIDEPKVLIADEPTAALDPGSAALVEELLRYQLLARRSIILASHDAGLIDRLAHERLLLPRPAAAQPSAGGVQASAEARA